MNILLVNTSDNTGGAAVACFRLMEALTKNGAEVRMLVRDHHTDDPRVRSVKGKWWQRMLNRITPGGSYAKVLDHLLMLPHAGFSWKKAWAYDANFFGTDITETDDFQWADVIHLHWVNQGMLSIADIGRIIASGKRVVWTMHDLWPLDSVNHYREEAPKTPSVPLEGEEAPPQPIGLPYGRRPLRRSPVGRECNLPSFIERITIKRKQAAYFSSPTGGGREGASFSLPTGEGRGGASFVACSRWLMNEAKANCPLAKDADITSIPNPIDTSVFYKQDKRAARRALGLPEDGKIILFVSQNLTDERKGARYFIEAINNFSSPTGGGREGASSTGGGRVGAILGSNGDAIAERLNVPTYPLGYLTDQATIAMAYNSADVFVLPSLNDNLPNTIMEAMACGVPCVAFSIGGIPEMIDHNITGYLATPRDADDLARGIQYALDNNERLSEASIRKVEQTYSQQAVATAFMKLYKGE